MKRLHILAALIAAALASSPIAHAQQSPAYLRVTGTHLTMNGANYAVPSINAYDLIHVYATDPAKGYRKLSEARAKGFVAIRFFATGLYNESTQRFPIIDQWKDPITRPQFLAAYDKLVFDANLLGVKLIPSLVNGISDPSEVNRPSGAACNIDPYARFSLFMLPGSENRATMKQFALDLVSRYKNSEQILFWEIANEPNLNAKERNPAKNCVARADIVAYIGEMAAAIKQTDPNHLLASGAMQEGSDVLLQDIPGSLNDAGDFFRLYNTIPNIDIPTVHVYGEYVYSDGSHALNQAELLTYFKSLSDSIQRPLWIGEFGMPAGTPWSSDEFHNAPTSVLLARQYLGIDLATAWAWESREYGSATVHPEMVQFSLDPGEDDDAIAAITAQPALMGRNRTGMTWSALTGDFNGDHRTDFLSASSRGTWQVSLMANQPQIPRQWLSLFGDNLADPGANPFRPLVGDWNRDGKTDVGLKSRDGRWFVAMNDGRNFVGTAQWLSNFGNEYLDPAAAPTEPFTGDWNGDGWTDIGLKTRDGRWYIAMNDGTKFTNLAQVLSNFGDQNADPNAGYSPVIGDWNGDGKTDFGLRTRDGRWFVALNTASGFVTSLWLTNFGNETIDTGGAPFRTLTADWNGDGKTDIGLKSRDGRWYAANSTGNAFNAQRLSLSGFGNETLDSGGGGMEALAGDWNGDGKADIGIRTFDGRWYVAWGDGTLFANTWFWH